MKYVLTHNTKTIGDTTLYRIQALRSFANVREGDLGGWVSSADNLAQEGNAWVSGNAQVYGDALVFGNALVSGNAQVSDNALVSGNAHLTTGTTTT